MLRQSNKTDSTFIRVAGCICFIAILCQSAHLTLESTLSKASYASAGKLKKDFRSDFAGGADAVLSASFGVRPVPPVFLFGATGRAENLRLWPLSSFHPTRSPPPEASPAVNL
jgi:hypothetical protein